MRLEYHALSALFVISAFFLGIGGILLRVHSLVPIYLSITTVPVIFLIMVVAHFVWRGRYGWAFFGCILATVSILTTLVQPAHIYVILRPFGTWWYTLLAVSDLTGFIIAPAVYLILFLAKGKDIKQITLNSRK